MSKPVRPINKKKKFVADGVFNAELHAFFSRALVSAGYAGMEVRVKPLGTEIRILATKVQDVIGENKGRRIRELTSLLQKRFGYEEGKLELVVRRVERRGLCASAQVESLKFKLLSNIPLRLAANSVINSVLKDGAKGCEVIVSGKLSQQRAKTMKFKSGYMICSGQPKLDFIDVGIRHVFLKQGIMGVKVKIMLPYDPTGKAGVKKQIPDNVIIEDPREKDNKEEDVRVEARPAPTTPGDA
jgi:small subunit ribosomal protein S3e